MAISRIAIGYQGETIKPDALRATLAEFISTFIFVFTSQGATSALNKLTDNGSLTPVGLLISALCHAFGILVAMSVSWNISGGHVNPAVTLGAFVGGNITLIRGVFYWIGQLLGSVVACFLLKFVTGGMTTTAFSISSGVSVWEAVVFEIILTFILMYTIYATAVDPKKGDIGLIAPIAVSFIVAANILAGGAFSGASMNPALSFGPAVVSWTWTSNWVYWVGPLVGAGIAALLFDGIFIGNNTLISNNTLKPLPSTDV